MTSAITLLLLIVDILAIATLVGFLIPRPEEWEAPPSARSAAWLILFGGIIIASSLLLSTSGFFSSAGFIVLHTSTAASLVIINSRKNNSRLVDTLIDTLRNSLTPWISLALSIKETFIEKETTPEKWLIRLSLIGLTVFALLTCFIALFSEPLNYDSNTYRLSRIAAWLQNGKISWFSTNDQRLNYMPYYADLLMAWVISFHPTGYKGAAIVQWLGGMCCLFTISAWFTLLGTQRLPRLLALTLFVGLPVVSLEFFTTQTDLISAAFTISGLFFLRLASATPRTLLFSLAGLALGLAAGAKGTIFYWAFGIPLILTAWTIQSRGGALVYVRGIALAAIIAFTIAAPPYIRNWTHYGNPFAPKSHIDRIHAEVPTTKTDAAIKRAHLYFWQLFHAASNPWLPGIALEPTLTFLEQIAADFNPPPSHSFKRAFTLAKRSSRLRRPNEDLASFGIIGGLSIIIALTTSLATLRKHRCSREALILLFSSFLFFAFFSFEQDWTRHKYRYFTIFAPFIAIAFGSSLVAIPRAIRVAIGIFAICTCFWTAFYNCLFSHHHGLLTILNPSRSPVTERVNQLRKIASFPGSRQMNLLVSLPEDAWLAPLFRTNPELSVHLSATHDIPERLKELDQNDPDTPIGILLPPNSSPPTPSHSKVVKFTNHWLFVDQIKNGTAPVITRSNGFHGDGWTKGSFEISISHWDPSAEFTIILNNATPLERHINITSPNGSESLKLPPRSKRSITIRSQRPIWKINGTIDPLYYPSSRGSSDTRGLGIRIEYFTSPTQPKKLRDIH